MNKKFAKRIFSLDYKFKTGEMKGDTLQDSIDNNLDKITWLLENCDFEMNNEAFQYYTNKRMEQ